LFDDLGIPQEFVPVAKTAMNKHSQNDILYDPKRVTNITEELLKLCDDVFKWAQLPFDTKTPMEEFKNIFFSNSN